MQCEKKCGKYHNIQHGVRDTDIQAQNYEQAERCPAVVSQTTVRYDKVQYCALWFLQAYMGPKIACWSAAKIKSIVFDIKAYQN